MPNYKHGDNMEEEIKEFLSNRPKVVAAYGYGSGVFKQSGYNDKDKPQIDLILIVKDLKKWHLENIKLNKKDYSFIGKLFFKNASISKLKGHTGITYLSNIIENKKVFKYGTIEEKDFINYLNNWQSYYLPGRFQKTCLEIISTKKIRDTIIKNRENALMTGLLSLNKEKPKLIDVYTEICGLSYLGDTRMKFAENPRKVLNIVEGSFNEYKDIYGIENSYFKTDKNENMTIKYDKLIKDINKLPEFLSNYLKDEQDLSTIKIKINKYFTELNKKESSTQTIKGIFTNGIIRSIKYASRKVLKKLKK